jgi:F-type H+-transporting ATPase subunit delta
MFWPLFVLLMVVFAGMLVVLRQVLSQHYRQATSHLEGLSAEYLKRQDELKKRLGDSERQYKEQTAQAKLEGEQLVAQARKEAESARARTVEEARAEGERIVQQAMASRDALRKEIEQTQDRRVTERASALVREVLCAQLTPAVQSQWLSELLRNGLTQLKRVPSPDQLREIRVASAVALTEEQRRLLQRRVGEQLGRELPLKEAVDPALIAGLIITVGSTVLDGSLASKLEHALRRRPEAS